MASARPIARRLIPDLSCHLQWHNQSADHATPPCSRLDKIRGEVIELAVRVGLAIVDKFPSGTVRLHSDRRSKHSHDCRNPQPSRRLYSSYHQMTGREGVAQNLISHFETVRLDRAQSPIAIRHGSAG